MTWSSSSLLHPADGVELVVERVALLHHALGALRCRSRDRDLRPARSVRRGAPWLCRSQRCLLSSPIDCLMSSTSFSVSARMAIRIRSVSADLATARQRNPAFARARALPRARPVIAYGERHQSAAWNAIGETVSCVFVSRLLAAALLIGSALARDAVRAKHAGALREGRTRKNWSSTAAARPRSTRCRPAPSSRQYPGIKVTIHAGFSNVHNQKINEQLKAKKLDADLAILQTVSDFHQWKKEGVLAHIPAGRLGLDRPDLQGSGRPFHRRVRDRGVLRLQPATGEARGRAEVGARFPQARVQAAR